MEGLPQELLALERPPLPSLDTSRWLSLFKHPALSKYFTNFATKKTFHLAAKCSREIGALATCEEMGLCAQKKYEASICIGEILDRENFLNVSDIYKKTGDKEPLFLFAKSMDGPLETVRAFVPLMDDNKYLATSICEKIDFKWDTELEEFDEKYFETAGCFISNAWPYEYAEYTSCLRKNGDSIDACLNEGSTLVERWAALAHGVSIFGK
eukprot:TRINITY_DN1029_c0_g1_i1.p1 TRINITY_DN1029_c0_g1~~TRINITY_DN1029_c0_g1_i1.p1  ORF type:complete len:228 (-),score=35.85 TRINITY_DN1029_c0_g1_i1:31-663(-)